MTKLYGDQRAVDGVDLTVAPGTIATDSDEGDESDADETPAKS